MSTTRGLDIQRLDLDDVDAIEEIEQRSMPAPWSRMMFVSEIVKPTSICLGAFVDDALVAYVIVSRYVDAWHVMNLVVAPEYRRQGIATRLLGPLFDAGRRGRTAAASRSRCGSRTTRRSSSTRRLGFRGQGIRRGYYTDNREDALIMWQGTARAVILGLETSCDETAAALVTRDGEIRSSVVASQAVLHARFGGVVPEVASRRHLELVAPGDPRGARRGGRDARRRRARRRHGRPRADRRAARRRLGRQGAGVGEGPAARAGRPPARARRVALPRARSRSSRRSSACSRPAGTRCSSTSATAAATARSGRRSTTRPARRSTRARACSASATRAAPPSTGSPRTATRRRSTSRSRGSTASTSPSPA